MSNKNPQKTHKKPLCILCRIPVLNPSPFALKPSTLPIRPKDQFNLSIIKPGVIFKPLSSLLSLIWWFIIIPLLLSNASFFGVCLYSHLPYRSLIQSRYRQL